MRTWANRHNMADLCLSNIVRAVLFMIFFAVGLAAFTISMLADELLEQYIAGARLKRIEKRAAKIETLIADYDAVLQQLETNPNITDRLARVTSGTEHENDQTAYPKVTKERLQAAKKVLSKSLPKEKDQQIAPDWVMRCCRPAPRAILFLAGAGLIIISFTCFGTRTSTAGQPR